MNIDTVLRTASLVPLTGLLPLGIAILGILHRPVPATALAHPGRPGTGTGR
jgi:hypothetical protein